MRTIWLLATLLSSCLKSTDAKSRAAASASGGGGGGGGGAAAAAAADSMSGSISTSNRRRPVGFVPRGSSFSWIPSPGGAPPTSAAPILLQEVTRIARGGQRGGPDESGYDDWYNNNYDDNSYKRNTPQGRYSEEDRYSGRDRQGPMDDYYNEDRGYYEDRRSRSREESVSRFQVPEVIKTGNRKIGLPLLGIGGVLTILGISLFFNKTLMRLGNLFFVAGVPMTIGPGRTAGYFFQPKKARATGCLAFGIFLVFVGWPLFGIVLEAFGVLNLFGNMFPIAMLMLKSMPVIGPLLRGEGIPGGRSDRQGNDRYGGDYEDDYDGGGRGRGAYDRGYYDEGGDDRDDVSNQGYY